MKRSSCFLEGCLFSLLSGGGFFDAHFIVYWVISLFLKDNRQDDGLRQMTKFHVIAVAFLSSQPSNVHPLGLRLIILCDWSTNSRISAPHRFFNTSCVLTKSKGVMFRVDSLEWSRWCIKPTHVARTFISMLYCVSASITSRLQGLDGLSCFQRLLVIRKFNASHQLVIML